jgi:hypothetical protein
MNFIGNFKDWIQPALLDRILNNSGDPTLLNQPKTWEGNPRQQAWYEQFKNAGYTDRNFYSNMYNEKTKDIEDFNIVPPIEIPEGKNCNWWFIKFLPGSVACMHYDPHTLIQRSCTRYWMAMMDYQPGHCVVLEDGRMMTDYKAGDMWAWKKADTYHGVVNLSMTPRVTFQLSVYDSDDTYNKPKYYIDHKLD